MYLHIGERERVGQVSICYVLREEEGEEGEKGEEGGGRRGGKKQENKR